MTAVVGGKDFKPDVCFAKPYAWYIGEVETFLMFDGRPHTQKWKPHAETL